MHSSIKSTDDVFCTCWFVICQISIFLWLGAHNKRVNQKYTLVSIRLVFFGCEAFCNLALRREGESYQTFGGQCFSVRECKEVDLNVQNHDKTGWMLSLHKLGDWSYVIRQTKSQNLWQCVRVCFTLKKKKKKKDKSDGKWKVFMVNLCILIHTEKKKSKFNKPRYVHVKKHHLHVSCHLQTAPTRFI